MALLNIAMMDAAIVLLDAKYTYFNPRPSQADPSIKQLLVSQIFPRTFLDILLAAASRAISYHSI
jgi:hypothetical protein